MEPDLPRTADTDARRCARRNRRRSTVAARPSPLDRLRIRRRLGIARRDARTAAHVKARHRVNGIPLFTRIFGADC
jgi:hypothetical protein